MNFLANTVLYLSYPIVIGLSLLWSTTTVEKTLYDRYIVYNEGILLSAADAEGMEDFYSNVLDFPHADLPRRYRELHTASYQLAERQVLHIASQAEGMPEPTVLIIRVRNGFSKLHSGLLERYGKDAHTITADSELAAMPLASVGSVYRGALGDQFAVRDPAGTVILFYQKRLRLF